MHTNTRSYHSFMLVVFIRLIKIAFVSSCLECPVLVNMFLWLCHITFLGALRNICRAYKICISFQRMKLVGLEKFLCESKRWLRWRTFGCPKKTTFPSYNSLPRLTRSFGNCIYKVKGISATQSQHGHSAYDNVFFISYSRNTENFKDLFHIHSRVEMAFENE